MITVATRDINQVLRKNTSSIELECAFKILELSIDKKAVIFNINKELKAFTNSQVHYAIQALILLGLVTYKRVGRKLSIHCINSKSAKTIIENKETLSFKSEIKTLHELMSITQCEALEVLNIVLDDILEDGIAVVNVRELCRENSFEVVTVRMLLKYLKIAGVIESSKQSNDGTTIKITNEKGFKYIVNKAKERLDRLWREE